MSRVFVVDDEPDVADLVCTILTAHGFEVRMSTDGRSALSQILADPPDIAIIDLMMPDLDGFELLSLLRIDSRTADLPILILSARSTPGDQLRSLQLGANAYVCKPFSPNELVRQLRNLLQRQGSSTSA